MPAIFESYRLESWEPVVCVRVAKQHNRFFRRVVSKLALDKASVSRLANAIGLQQRRNISRSQSQPALPSGSQGQKRLMLREVCHRQSSQRNDQHQTQRQCGASRQKLVETDWILKK